MQTAMTYGPYVEATNAPYKGYSGNVLVAGVANSADASINNANSEYTVVKADQSVTGNTQIAQSNGGFLFGELKCPCHCHACHESNHLMVPAAMLLQW